MSRLPHRRPPAPVRIWFRLLTPDGERIDHADYQLDLTDEKYRGLYRDLGAAPDQPSPTLTPAQEDTVSVLFEVDDAVATVTINRPAKLNALDYATIDALGDVLDSIEADSSIRAVVLTGAGDRAFSAGADINDLAASVGGGVDRALREIVGRGQGLTRRIENFPKPIIAAVNGLAYGGGCEVVEAAPLAIASRTATFAKPEITLGFPPPFGGSQRLPRHVGRKHGLEMILTGERIDAYRAAELGIVNRVVAPEELLDEAVGLAGRIIRHAPTAVTACLAAVTRGINLPIDEGLAVEASWFAVIVTTQGVSDGIGRFLTRRGAAASKT